MFQKPQIGSQVTIKTQYFMPSYHRQDRYAVEEITGTIVNDFKWLQPNQFVISNPKNPSGVSVVSLEKVIEIKDLQGRMAKLALPTDDYKEWVITGSKGNEYLVIRVKGKYNCTCPGYTYRKSCRHIAEVGNE